MKYDDIEKYLSRFKINEPGPDLKQRVLLKAKSAWKESGETVPVYVHNFKLWRNCAYALAGVILLSVITLKVTQKAVVKPSDSKPMIARQIEQKNETKIFRSVKKESGPEVIKHVENDSEMKDLYASVGLDYRSRQLLLSLSREDKLTDRIRARLEQQKQLLKELES
ncbi:MAG: hypothetical protein WC081_01630 [Candidatus Ratteibacteria bacterium]|jgi:hypothetical protein